MIQPLQNISRILLVCLGLCYSGHALGQRLVNEKFDYGATAGALTTVSNSAWTAYDTPGVEPVGYAPGSLTLPGMAADNTGKAVFASASGAAGREDVTYPFTTQNMSTVNTLYASALVNFSTAGNAGIFFHFLASNTSHFSRVFVRASGDGYNLGINRNLATVADVSWLPTVYEFGKTYLLVMKYEHVAGEKNDNVKLWALSAVPASEAAAGTGAVSTDDGSDASNLLGIGIRQTGVSHSGTLDNVLVGNTWADVMPAATADTTPPAFVAGTPAAGATNVATNTNITLEFNELVSPGTGNFILSWPGGTSTLAATASNADFSGRTVTLSNLSLQTNTTYAVRVEATAVKDATGNFFAGISGNAWTFTTSSIAAVPGQVFTENFDYAAGTKVLDLPGWAHNGGTLTTNPVTVTEAGLSYQNLAGSNVGNAIAVANTGQGVDREIGTTFTEGSVYTSMLVNFNEVQETGNYFFYLNPAPGATNYYGRIFARRSSEGKFQLGLAKLSTITYGTTEYNIGETYLLVQKFTFVEGNNNDLVELFINPTPGSTEPTVATHTAAIANADPAAGIATFGFRQLQAATSPALTLDAIKVGRTWESVTPRAATQADTTPPTLVSGTPANGATNVATNLSIVLTFSEPVAPGTGRFTLAWNGGTTSVNATDANVAFAGNTVTISNMQLLANTTYAAQAEPTAVKDAAGNFFAGIAGNTWTFTTAQALGLKADVAGTFSVWPNPTTGAVKLQLPETLRQQGNIKITVYSLRGELILEASGTEQALQEQFNQKLGAAATGLYLVRVQAGEQTFQTRILKK